MCSWCCDGVWSSLSFHMCDMKLGFSWQEAFWVFLLSFDLCGWGLFVFFKLPQSSLSFFPSLFCSSSTLLFLRERGAWLVIVLCSRVKHRQCTPSFLDSSLPPSPSHHSLMIPCPCCSLFDLPPSLLLPSLTPPLSLSSFAFILLFSFAPLVALLSYFSPPSSSFLFPPLPVLLSSLHSKAKLWRRVSCLSHATSFLSLPLSLSLSAWFSILGLLFVSLPSPCCFSLRHLAVLVLLLLLL